MKEPTPRMLEVLRAFVVRERDATRRCEMTCNEIARACGFTSGYVKQRARDGRAMAPAQRVSFAVIGLRDRGLLTYNTQTGDYANRFSLTLAGRAFCREHRL